ncbi:MAG: hypothetical protein WD096_07730 [Actinomycetota bacterium]
MVHLPRQLFETLDIEGAVIEEVSRPRQAIPSRVLEVAVRENLDSATEYLRGLLIEGLEVAPGELLQANKGGRGYRPLTLLTLPERVLFQALAAALTSGMEIQARTFERWKEIHEAPIANPLANYIVECDVADFYDHIDHGLLGSELVSQTGKADLAIHLREFLHDCMGREFGLPQLAFASDLLSEPVIDTAERRLARLGYVDVVRFNDDFELAPVRRTHLTMT